MKTIKKLYRETYSGESVITNMTYSGGTWNFEREAVPNAVTNNQISNRAVVIGNGVSRGRFDLAAVKRHRGGLLASGALQSYGCNALYRDFAPDFLVATGNDMIAELANSDYCNDHIVYTSAKPILDYPGKFYLMPQDPGWNAGALATYLACFDGHQTIYLIGFDGIDSPNSGYNIYADTRAYTRPSYGYSEDYWVNSMLEVFNTYSDVEFVRVMPTVHYRMPEAWRFQVNLRQIDYRQFALEVDL